jgi:Terpene synthase family 2, C-terminal metal binding
VSLGPRYVFWAIIDTPHGRFWLRAMQKSCDTAQERFIITFSEYVYAVIEEASDRARGSIRGIKDYLRLTRLTAGPHPCFFPIEMDLDMPGEVMAHSSMENLRNLAAESLVLGNVSDVYYLPTTGCLTDRQFRIYTPSTSNKHLDTVIITLLLWL